MTVHPLLIPVRLRDGGATVSVSIPVVGEDDLPLAARIAIPTPGSADIAVQVRQRADGAIMLSQRRATDSPVLERRLSDTSDSIADYITATLGTLDSAHTLAAAAAVANRLVDRYAILDGQLYSRSCEPCWTVSEFGDCRGPAVRPNWAPSGARYATRSFRLTDRAEADAYARERCAVGQEPRFQGACEILIPEAFRFDAAAFHLDEARSFVAELAADLFRRLDNEVARAASCSPELRTLQADLTALLTPLTNTERRTAPSAAGATDQ